MPLARVEIDGRMAGDPELQFLPSGAAVATFRVATSDRKKEGDQWVDGPATFITVKCWREMAENVAESLHRGDPVFVAGKLEERQWTNNEGQERRSMEVTADVVGPSLRWCSARVSRTQRSQGQTQGQSAQPAQTDDPWATPPPAPAQTPPPQWGGQPAQAPPQWSQPQQATPAQPAQAPPQQAPPQQAQPAPAVPQYDEPPY